MKLTVGAVAPLIAFGIGSHFYPPSGPGGDEQEEAPPMVERRRYPPPELELGVVAAAKIAGIILAPLVIVASLFGVYLQGFRSDLRLDMQKVVSEALDRHTDMERGSYASLSYVAAMRDDLERLRREHDELEKQVRHNNELLQRLAQKNGLR